MRYKAIQKLNLSNFLASGYDFQAADSHLLFKFRTLNYFMAISLFFGALIGILGEIGIMKIGDIQPRTNIAYAFFNVLLIWKLRQGKELYRIVAWFQVSASLLVFIIALITVLNDEFRIAWFYVAIYLAYMLLGARAGNIIISISIFVIVVTHYYLELNFSDTAIVTAIFSLIVFGLLGRVYTTQMRTYENLLENNNVDLANSIKSLDKALVDANVANKTKSLFLANMSHEIRTPMNGMLSLVQVLRTTKLDDQQYDYLQSIERAGVILMALIDDLLDISRIESGRLDINAKPFRVWDFLDDILLQIEHLFDEKDVHFNVSISDEIPNYFITDEVRLKQVVLNLINNSVKFTNEGEVNFLMNGKYIDEQTFNLHIEVSDTGIGIPESEIENIFEPFQQISPDRIYNKGVGLGLPICKKIIEAMDGKVRINSEVGKGTKFFLDFIFPVSDSSESEEKKTVTNTKKSLEKITVLLVEDDQISRLAATTLLEHQGHEVIIAENGKEAVDIVKEKNVDVILMDVHMPEMNGVEATKIIKQQKLTDAPIIGMTASVMNEERQTYIEAGMDVLVEKPVNFDDLMDIINNKIGN